MTIFSLLVLVSNPKKNCAAFLGLLAAPSEKEKLKKVCVKRGWEAWLNLSILMKDNGTESESRQSSIFHISRPLNGEQLSTATFKASCGKDRILLELSRFFGFKTTSVVFMLLKLTFVKDNHFTLFNCLFVWYDSRRKLVAPPDRFIYLR